MTRKKTAELAVDKLIIIILAVLILALIIILIFKVDILQKFRDLPGYVYEKGDKETIASTDKLISLGCEIPIAVIGSEQKGLFIGKNERGMLLYDFVNKKWQNSTKLYWEGETINELKIMMAKTWADSEVGKMEKGKIVVSASVSDLEAQAELSKLNGAMLLAGTNFFCKTK